MDALTLGMVAGVMLLAAAVQGAVGFGFGLVAVAILSLALPVEEAAVLSAVPGLAINLGLCWRFRRCVSPRRLTPMVIAVIVATPLGVLLLDEAAARPLYALLAAVLVASVVHGAWPKRTHRPGHPLWMGIPMGGLAGVLAGVFGSGGPPLVAYIASQRFQKYRYLASLQAVLAVANTVRLVALVQRGTLQPRHLLPSGIGVVAAISGVAIGLIVLRRFSPGGLRIAVWLLLTAIAVRCVLQAVAA